MIKSESKTSFKESTKYLLLNLWVAGIIGATSYFTYYGPKKGQIIAYFMSGLFAGVSFTIIAIELYTYYSFHNNTSHN